MKCAGSQYLFSRRLAQHKRRILRGSIHRAFLHSSATTRLTGRFPFLTACCRSAPAFTSLRWLSMNFRSQSSGHQIPCSMPSCDLIVNRSDSIVNCVRRHPPHSSTTGLLQTRSLIHAPIIASTRTVETTYVPD